MYVFEINIWFYRYHLHYITLAFIYMVLHFRRLMMFWFLQH